MKDNFCLRVCALYHDEVSAAVRDLGYDDVCIATYPPVCMHAQQATPAARKVLTETLPQCSDIAIVGACFLAQTHQPHHANHTGRLIHLKHCLYMFAGQEWLEPTMLAGNYLLTPGWLKYWRQHLDYWGFDQEVGRTFFQECIRGVILLDTGIDDNAVTALQQFATFVEVPYQIQVIGLDYLKLLLARIILEWRLDCSRQVTREVLHRSNRKIADYAMAFDLLVNLARIMTEEETVQKILELFAMLFGCTNLEYADVKAGHITRVFTNQGVPSGVGHFEHALAHMHDNYALAEPGDGFYLRIQYQQDTLGLMIVRDIVFPEYRDQYLNLALTIANLCGLAIANARTYRKLQETENRLRQERDQTERLRQAMTDLVVELDPQVVLEQIQVHLDKVVPCQISTIMLLEGNDLRIVSSRSSLPGEDLVGRSISVDQYPFPDIIQQQSTMILDCRLACKNVPSLPGCSGFCSWMGVPLIIQQHVMGILAVGSVEPDVYSLEQVHIAQAFASEAAIAIENARLFEKAHILAGTDSLTRLYNRRRFLELAEVTFQRARLSGMPMAIILLDIDHFKQINDTFSHMAGDQVLVQIARDLTHICVSGIVARYGGEEFILLLPDSNLNGARTVAERLRSMIAANQVETIGGPVAITISLGVAALEADVSSLDDLIWRADKALYAAKAAGRNRVCGWGEQSITAR